MRRPFAYAVVGMLLSIASTASADPPAATYAESRFEGGSVIRFEADTLGGGGPNAFGETLRRPPGAVRVGLIRPRFNFVPELLKSVENL
jgi:hypothetical protein